MTFNLETAASVGVKILRSNIMLRNISQYLVLSWLNIIIGCKNSMQEDSTDKDHSKKTIRYGYRIKVLLSAVALAAALTSISIHNTALATAVTAHCDRSGWPPCFDLGFTDQFSNPGARCPAGHSANYCEGWIAAQAVQITQTDNNRYNAGNTDGGNAAGTDFNRDGIVGFNDTPPPGHTPIYNQGYRNGYVDEWSILVEG